MHPKFIFFSKVIITNIEHIHLQFCKRLLSVIQYTQNDSVYSLEFYPEFHKKTNSEI